MAPSYVIGPSRFLPRDTLKIQVDSTPGVEGAWETFATDYSLSEVEKIISREHHSVFPMFVLPPICSFRSTWCPHCRKSQAVLRNYGSRGTRGGSTHCCGTTPLTSVPYL